MDLLRRKTGGGAATEPSGGEAAETFLPRRSRRRVVESFLMRAIATGGVVGIATAIAAILGTQDIDYWIVGLVASIVSVILAAVLWSSRTL